jgi:BirA family biotin operon repressor/biotin-[acetyl-CoA-carboxylase] ligase
MKPIPVLPAEADFDRILDETAVRTVDFHPAMASTNDHAMAIARETPGSRMPLLVLTETQTAGRGRGSNRWWADSGALTFSLLFEREPLRLPPHHWTLVSLAAGLAVSEVVAALPGAREVGIKWPNDVYLFKRKLAGILVEVPPQRNGTLVVGIGVNVNNSTSKAPAELQSTAIALRDVTGHDIPIIDFLIELLNQLWLRLAQVGPNTGDLLELWRSRSLLTGKHVRFDLGPRHMEGICEGIDDDGALLISTSQGFERCLSGTVTCFDETRETDSEGSNPSKVQ